MTDEADWQDGHSRCARPAVERQGRGLPLLATAGRCGRRHAVCCCSTRTTTRCPSSRRRSRRPAAGAAGRYRGAGPRRAPASLDPDDQPFELAGRSLRPVRARAGIRPSRRWRRRPTPGFAHEMPFGAELRPDGTVRFRLWAPAATRVDAGARRSAMSRCADEPGRRRLVRAGHGRDARQPLPLSAGRRPRSRRTRPPAASPATSTARAPSSTRSAYRLADPDWPAGPGTRPSSTSCTSAPSRAEGTFDGVRQTARRISPGSASRAIELMPVADFAGRRNWGYDGVLPFAPDSRLRRAGRPEAPDRRGPWRAG